ncbi:receptor-like protein EIX2 [Hevea brasiliensis]|uniref:receptor-like protein EIX2 n=1 Tax=Hevea brasiliensis TaxID=3981 RepID=UPI0025D0C4C1|nr:receptor-like protein EIX2 [Hevea brasiliensis]
METFPFLWIICLLSGELIWGGFAQLVHCNAAEREALLDLKMGLNDSWNRLSSWHGTNCCQWSGIACDNTTGAVLAVDLPNSSGRQPLGGEIRPSLAKLKSLKYLDLSGNKFSGKIPHFFSSLENLQYLNLSFAGFSGAIPPNLGNLSSLQFLDVSSFSSNVDNLEWVSGLVSLKYLNMYSVDLSKVGGEWIEPLNKLPLLSELHLEFCVLSGFIYSISSVNFTSLKVLKLRDNSFKANLPNWFVNISSLVSVDIRNGMLTGRIPLGFGELPNLQSLKLNYNVELSASCFQLFSRSWKKIQVLDLSITELHGRLPALLGNMTSLIQFDLHFNYIEGGIPSSIGKLSNLQYIDLSLNNLTGSLPDSIGQLKNLVELRLNNNLLQGSIPSSIGNLQRLTTLTLASNKLNGTLPDSIGLLSELSSLDVSLNKLTGVISEAHFHSLGKLENISLSENSFILNVSSNWVPPFQVIALEMGSCHLGMSFPSWLKSQKQVHVLDFSGAGISGSIPNWFWDMTSSLAILNVSFNSLEGHIPNPFNIISYATVDLSFNQFKGPIPLPNVILLDLSNNQFSGSIPENIGQVMSVLSFLSLSGNKLTGAIPASIGEISLDVLDLSKNNLAGSIPSNIGNCSSLTVLDLQKNNLSGEIPNSIGQITGLQTLHLSNNQLSGKIPSSLQNLSKLETLDFGNNMLTGNLPRWIGEALPHLRILSLRSNKFSGELPLALSNSSSLQILDLAENQLNGSIPANLSNLKAMTQQQNVNHYLLYGTLFDHHNYQENIYVTINGLGLTYTRTLSLLTSIDMSGNNLSGELPEAITKLVGLEVLNLSRNHISGQIPKSISELRQLLSLDLSGNRLSGPIPQSISSLTFLGNLNVSNNNLSGIIPSTNQMSTFNASSFAGNPGLCGDPLTVKCSNDSNNGGDNYPDGGGKADQTDNGNGFIDKWFYMSIGVGFAAGLLLPYLVFAMKRSWGGVYFAFVDGTAYRLSSEKMKAAARRRNRGVR